MVESKASLKDIVAHAGGEGKGLRQSEQEGSSLLRKDYLTQT